MWEIVGKQLILTKSDWDSSDYKWPGSASSATWDKELAYVPWRERDGEQTEEKVLDIIKFQKKI